MKLIKAADILLPDVKEMSRWSVIACDQFTSDRAYWEETRRIVGDAPSTLNMILPEAFMGTEEARKAGEEISVSMKKYLDGQLFRKLPASFLYVERTLRDGSVRHGIVAAVDLEEYDYKPEKNVRIKATEHTVEERLYKRIELREKAVLELPHVIIFYEDPENAIAGGLAAGKAELKQEYDFDLMQGGGRIAGWSVSGAKAEALEETLNALLSGGTGASLAVGDGNHSLATAKLCWDRIKESLSETEKETHPARYALAELVNVYDSGIRIEPIHRVLFGTDASGFCTCAEAFFRAMNKEGKAYELKVGSAVGEQTLTVAGIPVGRIIEEADRMIADFLKEHGGTVDYIHDEASAVEKGCMPGSAYLLLPAVEKEDIFETVRRKELFPKKSFSIGSAREKRYYLECRKFR